MSQIINLNRARKAKARAENRQQADANAARFGRTKAQKAREEADRQRAEAQLDGHERE